VVPANIGSGFGLQAHGDWLFDFSPFVIASAAQQSHLNGGA
jgi:hypothetical protein